MPPHEKLHQSMPRSAGGSVEQLQAKLPQLPDLRCQTRPVGEEPFAWHPSAARKLASKPAADEPDAVECVQLISLSLIFRNCPGRDRL